MKKLWTKEKLDILKKMTEERKSIKEISEALGVTKAAINYARKHYNLIILRAWNESEDKQLIEMSSKGITNKEIADELGRTIKAVIMRKNTLGIKSTKKIGWDECIANLKKKYNLK